jgi:hypothetical protein
VWCIQRGNKIAHDLGHLPEAGVELRPRDEVREGDHRQRGRERGRGGPGWVGAAGGRAGQEVVLKTESTLLHSLSYKPPYSPAKDKSKPGRQTEKGGTAMPGARLSCGAAASPTAGGQLTPSRRQLTEGKRRWRSGCAKAHAAEPVDLADKCEGCRTWWSGMFETM